MKPWVLEVNCLPSLSSSSIFDKQVKTMLICDTFTLIGMRGFDKQTVKPTEPKPSDPVFKTTMSIEDLEVLGSCSRFEESSDHQAGMSKILKNIYKDSKQAQIPDSRSAKGSGPGFSGEELLSKDELNLIMDLEDE